ncbi:FKBP-type peptidyl-prolyl cis-trans isomerase [Sphingobacterium paludis]|uniref:Peptidyl-prolyl cis-trans isomerase n=1 Tax=Sphingobacterium paludis TaxID=1476465 RepID=A0A4R7D4D3_9SPHI|nr:FKBP-type peptidyl-prolyl cis-trans isomerase [Sphingobacterium paludis]TDS15720.1 FKBP-type peptidyl-prolyl cis-trans isomerase FkpA [Sphingobacterium paludis]
MKKICKVLIAIVIAAISFTSCSNDDVFDPQQQLELEKPVIEAYVKRNYPNAQQLENSGIWYEIISQGEANSFQYTVKDSLNQKFIFSEAVVNYTGKLVADGTVFDKTDNVTTGDTLSVSMNLNTGQATVIQAWTLAFFPKTITVDTREISLGALFDQGAQRGSKFRIISPSGYGYGNMAQGGIPANSPLDFEVEVLEMRPLRQRSTTN